MKSTAAVALALALAACRTAPVAKSPPPPPPAQPIAPTPVATPTPPPAPPPAYQRDDLVKLRSEAATVLEKQADAYWQSWVFGTDQDLAGAYAGHEKLFTPETVRTLREAAAQSSGDDARALTDFADYVAGELVARATADDEDRLDALEAKTTVTVDGEQHAWRSLAGLVADEPNAQLRQKLDAAELSLLPELAPLVAEEEKHRDAAIASLGFESPATFAAELRHADLDALDALAKKTLDATEATYGRLLTQLAQDELALPLSKLHASDLPRLLRPGRADALFPADRARASAEGVFASLGLDVATEKGLTLHTSALPKKNPRPVCFPVRPPEDVRVSLVAAAGPAYLRDLLHELAHAEAYLHEDQPRWELRVLDGEVAMEATASVVSNLVGDPAFVKGASTLTGSALEAFVRRQAARRLFEVRHAAADVEFAVARLEGKAGDPAATYRTLLARADGFALAPEEGQRWLLEGDDLAGAADELRAELLAAELARSFEKRFGPTWWTSKDAGRALVAIWRRGTAPTGEELAKSLGDPAIAPNALVAEIESRLAAK